VWLSSINMTDLLMALTEVYPRPIFLVRQPLEVSELQLELPTLLSKPTRTRRSLTSLPGVWVPPIVFRTPEGEQPSGYTRSGLRELWSEITGTLLVSPEPK